MAAAASNISDYKDNPHARGNSYAYVLPSSKNAMVDYDKITQAVKNRMLVMIDKTRSLQSLQPPLDAVMLDECALVLQSAEDDAKCTKALSDRIKKAMDVCPQTPIAGAADKPHLQLAHDQLNEAFAPYQTMLSEFATTLAKATFAYRKQKGDISLVEYVTWWRTDSTTFVKYYTDFRNVERVREADTPKEAFAAPAQGAGMNVSIGTLLQLKETLAASNASGDAEVVWRPVAD